MKIGSSLQSISTPTTPSTNGFGATYSESAYFCSACLKKTRREEQRPSVMSYSRQRFAGHCENSEKHRPRELQKKLGYHPTSVLDRGPQQVSAKKEAYSARSSSMSHRRNEQSENKRRRSSERRAPQSKTSRNERHCRANVQRCHKLQTRAITYHVRPWTR